MTTERQFRVQVRPGGYGFVADGCESILEAGRRAGLTLPQACRNGNCLRCEGALVSGQVKHQRTGAVLAAGAMPLPVLPCIVSAQTDCQLELPGVYGPGELPVVEVAAQVVAVEPLNHNVVRVHLRLPAGKRIARLAGQYLEILDEGGGDNGAYAFSMASPPATGRDIELHVRYGEENPASLRVLDLLRRERIVRVRLPQGECTLIGEPRLPLAILAGSTGFAQACAYVGHAIAQCWTIPITLYRGVRTPADLYLPDLPAQWLRDYPAFRYVPVISDAEVAPGMRRGHVHDALLADGPDPDSLLVYACGSPPMVYAAVDGLTAAGLPADRIFSDVFAWAPRAAGEAHG